MATYKVIQDIEAEDKILGPFTFRQFVYGLIAFGMLFMCYVSIIKGVPFLLILFLPPALFTGFFALPIGGDQPTEVWALAKIRFYIKPRKRIWDQSGVKELVTITVPKRIERVLTDGLSQVEVKSRLQALANTIDSRGWAIKNVNVNMFAQPNPVAEAASDRLIDINSLPQEVPSFDVQASDDMLDTTNNPVAQQFSTLINDSEQSHRQKILAEMSAASAAPAAIPHPPAQIATTTAPPQATPVTPTSQQPPNDYWFLNQPSPSSIPANQTVFGSQVVQPGTNSGPTAQDETPAEEAIVSRLKSRHAHDVAYNSHLRTLQPLGSQPQTAPNQPTQQTQPTPTEPVTAPPNAAILALASNDDLNVATLAREAQKANNPEPPDDEVVISLH